MRWLFSLPEILEMALLPALGKLPEPKLAHKFYWRANLAQPSTSSLEH